MVDEGLEEHPAERQREADDPGHHRDVDISVMRVTRAITPGFRPGPGIHQFARSPEGLIAVADERVPRDMVEGEFPDVVTTREARVRHQLLDHGVYRVECDGSDGQHA